MREKHRWLSALFAAALCALALSAVGASSAWALELACKKIEAVFGQKGTYEDAACTKENHTTGLYVLVDKNSGLKMGENRLGDLWCYKTDNDLKAQLSMYEDPECLKLVDGEKEYIRILVPLRTTCIKGQGSSLQKTAQLVVWIPLVEVDEHCVSYTASGSAAGLKAFGVGKLESPKTSGEAFIGTDDAPNGSFKAGQLHEMEEEAKGVAGKEQDLVIPVAQAAIAVIVNTPKGCKLTSISNEDLQKVWNGETTKWSQITGASPKAECEKSITRIVRKDGSGTTYQFKHYLFEINEGKLKGTTLTKSGKTVAERTWAELQEEEEKNLEWPEETGLSPVFHALTQGGGGEALEVLDEEQGKKEGTIGYAALADARAKYNEELGNQYHWLAVENEALSPVKDVEPGTDATEPSTKTAEANCEETGYTGTIPAAGFDKDWSGVYGGNPGNRGRKGKNKHYPICTLTWDVALAGYEQAGLAKAEGEAASAYLGYVSAETEGQEELKGHDYNVLPTSPTNIQTIAENTAAKVGSR